MKNVKYLLLLWLISYILAACNQFNTAPADLYKSPLFNTSPTAISTVFVPTPIPTPFIGKGSVTGRLINNMSGEPIGGIIVYLGTVSPFKIENDESYIITVLPSSSPSALTDNYGYFTFLNIDPGVYAMVIWLPEKSWIVSAPDTGKNILVEVKAGKITILGDLFINPPN